MESFLNKIVGAIIGFIVISLGFVVFGYPISSKLFALFYGAFILFEVIFYEKKEEVNLDED